MWTPWKNTIIVYQPKLTRYNTLKPFFGDLPALALDVSMCAHITLRVKSKQRTQRLQFGPAVWESSLLLTNQSYWRVSHHEGDERPIDQGQPTKRSSAEGKSERSAMGHKWPRWKTPPLHVFLVMRDSKVMKV